MLYLIGGAARSGKTILTQRLFHERGVPYFCLDYFSSALEVGAPELGFIAEEANLTRNPKLWPRIAPLLRNIVLVEPAYTVDGDALDPHGVAGFMREVPGQVRACFLGFARTTPERKLAEIRRYPGGVNDWIQKHNDEYILQFMQDMIAYSRYIEAECRALGLPYFDVSENFCEGIDCAFEFLSAE